MSSGGKTILGEAVADLAWIWVDFAFAPFNSSMHARASSMPLKVNVSTVCANSACCLRTSPCKKSTCCSTPLSNVSPLILSFCNLMKAFAIDPVSAFSVSTTNVLSKMINFSAVWCKVSSRCATWVWVIAASACIPEMTFLCCFESLAFWDSAVDARSLCTRHIQSINQPIGQSLNQQSKQIGMTHTDCSE